MFEQITIALAMLVVIVGAWVLICNFRTYRQRMQIIDWAYADANHTVSLLRAKQYNKVTYDRHLWHLVTFRNPKKLYDFNNCP